MKFPHGEYEIKTFRNLGLQFAGKCISNTLPDLRNIVCTLFVYSGSKIYWNFRILWGVSKKNRLEESNGRDLSFLGQIMIKFLLPFTGCRKVLGKMPDVAFSLQPGVKGLKIFKAQNFFLSLCSCVNGNMSVGKGKDSRILFHYCAFSKVVEATPIFLNQFMFAFFHLKRPCLFYVIYHYALQR